jgi:dienelactone hydrolase
VRRDSRTLLTACFVLLILVSGPSTQDTASPSVLPGTEALTLEGDIASQLVEGVDRFLLRKIDESAAARARYWKRDLSSPEAYERSVEPNRKRLAHILGVRDARVPFDGLEYISTTTRSSLVDRGDGFEVHAVRWPAFGGVHGEGLLLEPVGRKPVGQVIAIPDADVTPEQIAGLVKGTESTWAFAEPLAVAGFRVVVPVLIDRRMATRRPGGGGAELTSREFIYRSAFELGRHLIGYELQKVFAVIDWMVKQPGAGKIGVIGWGEGGMLALYAAALDTRIAAACVSGYFDDRRGIWQEPLDRNVFGLLDRFGDAELATLVAPRTLIVEAGIGPELWLPGNGGAPARLVTPRVEAVDTEIERAERLMGGLVPPYRIVRARVPRDEGDPLPIHSDALHRLRFALTGAAPPLSAVSERPPAANLPDAAARQARQLRELDRHNQELLVESPYVRADFMKKLDTSSLEAYARTAAEYRKVFRDEIIGAFDEPRLPLHPRTRRSYKGAGWTGYEVVLDVFPDVIAYGILLVPDDLEPGEKRPVVVCQHGLEGRPRELIQGDTDAYHDVAARLAERGFVTFAPQNLYIFEDRFRTLQRKANPLGKTLFSIMVPQHQQIVDWLETLDFVDPTRIAFYGLSYGGKSAMRIPSLVTDYSLSISSADFNEWVWKNASSRSPYSYVWLGEYEIFEFDLGSTFNYAEMAALIAPRPFMVERGHHDIVAPSETVGSEFAKVLFLYEARLKLRGRAEIEWFDGPHTINGQGTFDFLHRHLSWPKPPGK